MSEPSDILNDFIAVLKGDVGFYEEASRNVTGDKLKELFANMVAMRNETILELAPIVQADNGFVRVHTDFVGELHKSFAHLRATFQDYEKAYLTELAKLEARTVSELEECIDKAPSAVLKAFLSDMLPRYRKASDALAGMAAAA